MGKYNVRDKFVIEISEDITDKRWDNVEHYKVKGISKSFNKDELDKLEKLDNEKQYIKGLNDAWELAKKVGEFDGFELSKIFGVYIDDEDDFEDSPYSLVMKMKPQEALAKLEVYEKEQNEIKVGDVLKAKINNMKCVVSSSKGCHGYVLTFSDGSGATKSLTDIKRCYTKTGKHIDIQNILQQIGGSINE